MSNFKHGHTWRENGKIMKTRVYKTWESMISRCKYPSDSRFKRYGGRGITVCSEWLNFQTFLKDMGEKPEGLTLDRINPNGNYEPSNCRWADWNTQNFNKNHSHKFYGNQHTQIF